MGARGRPPIGNVDAIIAGAVISDELLTQWKNNLISAMANDTIITFAKNLRDKLLTEDETHVVEKVLVLYGDILIDRGVLSEKADDTVRILFNRIIDRKNAIETTWLRTAIEGRTNILGKCEASTYNYFKERIKSMKDDTDLDEEFRRIIGHIYDRYLFNPTTTFM